MFISRLFITCVVFSVAGLPSCFSTDQLYERCLSHLICGSEPSVFPNKTYPFWGDDVEKPKFCGQREFELSCKGDQNLTLEIGDLTLRVVTANLDDKAITVADDSFFEQGCPKILNFTGNNQFTLNHNTEKIDVFTCRYPPRRALSNITCRANHENWTTYYVFPPNVFSPGCHKAGEVPMLRSAKNALHGSNYTLEKALEGGFELRYSIKNKICLDCSISGGICGSESGSESFRCLCADRPHNSSCNDNQG